MESRHIRTEEEFAVRAQAVRQDAFEGRLHILETKVDEMLDILKFWKLLMRLIRSAAGAAIVLAAFLNYGHTIVGWLHNIISGPRSSK